MGVLSLNLLELPNADAFMERSSSASSASCNAWAALNDKARRSLPLSPPLRSILALGVGSRGGKSLSSRDIRFSAAVKLPCDRGDGRAGRRVVDDNTAGVVPEVGEVDIVATAGVKPDGRADIVVEVDDDDDEFRWWGPRSGLGLPDADDTPDEGELLAEFGAEPPGDTLFRLRTLEFADGALWPLCAL